VFLLLFALGAVNAVLARMQCVDAARDAALASARGGDGTGAGQRRAPAGAAVAVTLDGDRATATVRVTVHPLGPHLPSVTVAGTACARAGDIVAANGARLLDCRVDGLDLVVSAGVGPARAAARAGPVPG